MPVFTRFVLIGALLWAGCSGSRHAARQGPPQADALVVPPGVDSMVAAYADSLGQASFVSIPDQEVAAETREEAMTWTAYSDTLWHFLELAADTTAGRVDPAAAEAALRAANRAAGPLNQLIQLTQSGEIDSREGMHRQTILLGQAQHTLEESIRLNPFDEQTQGVLARVYTAQAQRLGKADAYDESIRVLEKLTRLRPDQHNLFLALANNYYQLRRWTPALQNYERAERVYRETYDLVPDPAEALLDSTLLFQYVTRQADVQVWRRDAPAALAAYERALGLAQVPEDIAFVRGEMAWIGWDGGNIAATATRDSLVDLEQSGRIEEAERGFRKLLDDVSTQKALDETEWRLAAVQYKTGRGDEAARRLLGLVQRTSVDANGAPVDSLYARYFDTYGTICFNQAMIFLGERRDNRTALQYLEQAAAIPWKERPRAYLESAKLLRSNVREAKRRAEQALTEAERLSVADRKDLYGLLATFHRTEGNFAEARKYLELYRSM
jgi:tetratricopeptide (TPR) repeat protein